MNDSIKWWIIAFSFLALGSLGVYAISSLNDYIDSYQYKGEIELGTITDFQISAGGFGSNDKAVVEVNNKTKYIATAGIRELQTGYKLCKDLDWNINIVKEECNIK